MKICAKCKEEKELINFSKNKMKKDGFQSECKICTKFYCKQHYDKNIDKRRKEAREYYFINKDFLNEKTKTYRLNNVEKIKEWAKKSRLKNTEKYNKYYRDRRSRDSLFKLTHDTRSRIGNSFRRNGYTKKSQSYKILGCSYKDFKIHLEKQFTKGMSWENQGEWHLDHIYPVSLAKDEEELIRLNHYTNFQPLWAIDNFKKGNKIIEKQLTLI